MLSRANKTARPAQSRVPPSIAGNDANKGINDSLVLALFGMNHKAQTGKIGAWG